MRVTIEQEGAIITEVECDYVLMATHGDVESKRKVLEIGNASKITRLDAASEISAHILTGLLTGTNAHWDIEDDVDQLKKDLDDPKAIQELVHKSRSCGGGRSRCLTAHSCLMA